MQHQRVARVRYVRRREDVVVALASIAVLCAGMVAVRHGTVTGFERSVFRAVNDLPGALYPVLWPFQQLGTIVVGPIAAIIAAIFRKFRLAAALGLAIGGCVNLVFGVPAPQHD